MAERPVADRLNELIDAIIARPDAPLPPSSAEIALGIAVTSRASRPRFQEEAKSRFAKESRNERNDSQPHS
jgi:hypothetical protein